MTRCSIASVRSEVIYTRWEPMPIMEQPTYQELTERVRELEKELADLRHTQEELRRTEKRYRTFLEFVPYAVALLTLDGRVTFVNSAFTEIFGWTPDELIGQRIPYIPQGLVGETQEYLGRLIENRVVMRHETKRLTKGGRVLDVVIRAAVYDAFASTPAGELIIIRDVTREKRIAQHNAAMLRISTGLHAHPDLEGLLDYISSEVRVLVNAQGAIVVLRDEEKNELFFLGVAYDDSDLQRKAKEIRYPADNPGVAAQVIRTGEPLLIPDTSRFENYSSFVDQQLGYTTRDILAVPLRSGDHIIGVLLALNKQEGIFDQTDVELLMTVAGTLGLSIENARFADQIRRAYMEVSSMNRAKDKVINHLSHELKTPISVLLLSLTILSRKLAELSDRSWQNTIERARRNLDRLMEIQYQVEDIMRERPYPHYGILVSLLDACADELEVLIAEEVGEGPAVVRIRRRIDALFAPRESVPEEIRLDAFVPDVLEKIEGLFPHREIHVVTDIATVSPVWLPPDVAEKVVEGLVKNAIENTPDEGYVHVRVRGKEGRVILEVQDEGVGITAENQRRIFEGFFTTRDTMAYSSKRPYDFNAGGKGVDLLRMKVFGERYGFEIDMASIRCRFIPKEADECPGRISACRFVRNGAGCRESGGTTFRVEFPTADRRK
ncbi:PAS domain S-box protein [Desulfatiglans anilini]|uniref:PAS domain S-box protein n=1 Tax=Desulfatiglans anilini TaxID=90728 RepID=UPI00041C3EF0|nr:PAS domain S-box protein [Desulfatiglans anilini]